MGNERDGQQLRPTHDGRKAFLQFVAYTDGGNYNQLNTLHTPRGNEFRRKNSAKPLHAGHQHARARSLTIAATALSVEVAASASTAAATAAVNAPR